MGGKWSAGPGIDIEYKKGNFFGGSIFIQLWGFAGESDRKSVNTLIWKYFLIYDLNWHPQTMQAWAEPWAVLRFPLLFNLRRDPYERGQITSNTYYDWVLDRVFILSPAAAYVGEFLKTFEEFPPSQKPGSFTIGDAKEKILDSIGSP